MQFHFHVSYIEIQRRQFQSHLLLFLFSFISCKQTIRDQTGFTGGFASVAGSAEEEDQDEDQNFYDQDQL